MKTNTIISRNFLLVILLLSLIMPEFVLANSKGLQARPVFEREQKIAIIVGIEKYSKNSGLRRLKYATKDARLLTNTLRKQGYSVKLLTNGDASKSFILDAIEELGSTLSTNQGTIIFIFSGHGYSSNSRNYLATYDAKFNKLSRTGLSLEDVENAIKKTPARRAIMFIDACRNEPGIEGLKATIKPGFVHRNSRGVKILYSTEFGKVSWEADRIGHGVFSYYLNKALNGQAVDNDGIITFSSLAGYMEKKVRDWTINNMPTVQEPFRAGESRGVFVLGYAIEEINPPHIEPQPRPTPVYPVASPRPPAPVVPENKPVTTTVKIHDQNRIYLDQARKNILGE